jgi:protein TonB
MTQRRTLILDLALALATSVLLAHAAQNADDHDKQPDGDSEEEVYDLGPGVAPPRVIKQVNPQYSTKRGVRVVGSVLIGLIVSSRGIPRDLHILKGLDKDVDQSALDAVQQWRFAPAQKDGKPVAVRISLEIAFHSM